MWGGETSGQIKIELPDQAGGAEFSAYKLLNIEKNGEGRLKVSVPDTEAKDFWAYYLDGDTDVTIPKIKLKLKQNGGDDPALQSSSVVKKFLEFPGTKPTPTNTATANGTSATISPNEFGFYIIQQTKAPAGGYIASAPVLACLPMQKVVSGTNSWLSSYTVRPKDDKIQIFKKVKVEGEADSEYKPETIAEIHDTLNYEIVADLATYGSDIGEITYLLEDELPGAIKYTEGSAVVEFHDTIGGNYETVPGYDVVYNGTNTLTLDLKTDYAVKFANYDKVRIRYKATFNQEETIVIEGEGNKNTATLNYTSAKGQTENITSTAKAYTLKLVITKVDNDHPDIKLEGAVFQVYRASADDNDPNKAIQFIDISGDYANGKHYRVATAAEIADLGTTKTNVIEVASNPKGELNIYGLNDQVYYFKETVAPVNYNLPDHSFPITVKPEDYVDASKKGDYNAAGTELDFNLNPQSEKIKNDSGINLPVTGGMGTILFTAIGLLLMVGAAYFLFAKKKGSR